MGMVAPLAGPYDNRHRPPNPPAARPRAAPRPNPQGDHRMSLANPRQQTIQDIASTEYTLNRVNFKDTQVNELFGMNVFNEEVARQRLPKPVYKSLQKTIK